jgi:hypothetical protein
VPRSLSDHALIAVKAGLSAVPYVGGSLAVLVDAYIPEQAAKAAQRTMKLLAEKVAALGHRVDRDIVNKEEFSELLRSSIQVCARTSREEKLRAAANILANHLLLSGDAAKSPYEELDHLVRCLETLSIGAIGVLGGIRRISTTAPMGVQGHIQFEQLEPLFNQLEPSLLMSLVSELRSLNLVRVQEPAIRPSMYGGILREISPIGRRFVERFIEGDM